VRICCRRTFGHLEAVVVRYCLALLAISAVACVRYAAPDSDRTVVKSDAVVSFRTPSEVALLSLSGIDPNRSHSDRGQCHRADGSQFTWDYGRDRDGVERILPGATERHDQSRPQRCSG
jgi:hypothetical protein